MKLGQIKKKDNGKHTVGYWLLKRIHGFFSALVVFVLIKCAKRELIELNELENVVVAPMPKSTK